MLILLLKLSQLDRISNAQKIQEVTKYCFSMEKQDLKSFILQDLIIQILTPQISNKMI